MEWKRQKDTDRDREAEAPTGVYCALTGRGMKMQRKAAIENKNRKIEKQETKRWGKHQLRPQAPHCLPPSPYLLELRAQGIHPREEKRGQLALDHGEREEEAGESASRARDRAPAIPAAGSRPRISGPSLSCRRGSSTPSGVLCPGADAHL